MCVLELLANRTPAWPELPSWEPEVNTPEWPDKLEDAVLATTDHQEPPATPAEMEAMAFQAKSVSSALKDHQPPCQLTCSAKDDPNVNAPHQTETPDDLETADEMDSLATMDDLAILAPLATLDPKDPLDHLDQTETLATPDHLAHLVRPDLALADPLANPVSLDDLALADLPDLLAAPETMATLAALATKDHLETQETLDNLAPLATLALLETLETREAATTALLLVAHLVSRNRYSQALSDR